MWCTKISIEEQQQYCTPSVSHKKEITPIEALSRNLHLVWGWLRCAKTTPSQSKTISYHMGTKWIEVFNEHALNNSWGDAFSKSPNSNFKNP